MTWVGKTSIEATMEVDQKDMHKDEWCTVTKARFVMVSRDPMNKGSAILNPLIAETEEEKALFLKGEGMHLQSFVLIIFSIVRWLCDRF